MPEGQVLEFDRVTKRFGSVTAVSDLSVRVEPGRVTGFLGPNGAGKTTSLRMMLGQIKPTEGTATIGGQSYAELRHPLRTVGAVLEEASFRPRRTAQRHLLVAAKANGIPVERVDEVLRLVGLQDDADTRLGSFSLGMRQRFVVASALLGDPGVLVLDEPANGLDPEGIRWMRLMMRRLADEGRTVLLSSHVLSEIEQVADDVVVLSKGNAVYAGGIDELASPAGGAVIVDASNRAQLITALSAAKLDFDVLRSGVTVRGSDSATVGAIAAAAGVPLVTLQQRGPSLEEVFLDLIHGRRGAHPQSDGAANPVAHAERAEAAGAGDVAAGALAGGALAGGAVAGGSGAIGASSLFGETPDADADGAVPDSTTDTTPDAEGSAPLIENAADANDDPDGGVEEVEPSADEANADAADDALAEAEAELAEAGAAGSTDLIENAADANDDPDGAATAPSAAPDATLPDADAGTDAGAADDPVADAADADADAGADAMDADAADEDAPGVGDADADESATASDGDEHIDEDADTAAADIEASAPQANADVADNDEAADADESTNLDETADADDAAATAESPAALEDDGDGHAAEPSTDGTGSDPDVERFDEAHTASDHDGAEHAQQHADDADEAAPTHADETSNDESDAVASLFGDAGDSHDASSHTEPDAGSATDSDAAAGAADAGDALGFSSDADSDAAQRPRSGNPFLSRLFGRGAPPSTVGAVDGFAQDDAARADAARADAVQAHAAQDGEQTQEPAEEPSEAGTDATADSDAGPDEAGAAIAALWAPRSAASGDSAVPGDSASAASGTDRPDDDSTDEVDAPDADDSSDSNVAHDATRPLILPLATESVALPVASEQPTFTELITGLPASVAEGIGEPAAATEAIPVFTGLSSDEDEDSAVDDDEDPRLAAMRTSLSSAASRFFNGPAPDYPYSRPKEEPSAESGSEDEDPENHEG